MIVFPKEIKWFLLVAGVLFAADLFVWSSIASPGNSETAFYFLDVGQGDSQLVQLAPEGGGPVVQVLIDGGASSAVLGELEKAMPSADRSIDIIVMTHPQLDHFGGLIDVVKHYDVGAFIGSGRKADTVSYRALMRVLEKRGVPYVAVREGDAVRYGRNVFRVLGPSLRHAASFEPNDGSVVLLFDNGAVRALYTGDISAEIERELAARYDLSAHILKVSHHGSRFSSDAAFLAEVRPAIAIIEVGKNSYGHPASAVLEKLKALGALIARTDRNGLVKIVERNGAIEVSGK